MIYYLVTDRFRRTAVPLTALPGLERRIRILTYEELFFERAGPIAHLILSDLDRLTRYEIENLERFVRAVEAAAPGARILNRPVAFLDRVALLNALGRAGINSFSVIRLDTGERPKSYPVFVRTEDGHVGPESGLLRDDEEFDAALAALAREGKPRRGRLAIGFAAEPGEDGLYRKYGAFIVGGQIIADELFISPEWAVKDAVAVRDPAHIAESFRYARDNPHVDALRRVFALAGVEYGRADYAFVDGKLQVYEVNTNPQIPKYYLRDERGERRALIEIALAKALLAIDDAAVLPRGRVRFEEVRPGPHDRRIPRRQMPVSLLRRLTGLFTARPKN